MDNFAIDTLAVRDYEAVGMLHGTTQADEIRALAGVAAYLCSALDALAVDGCDWLEADVRDILAAIERRISLLETIGSEASP